MGASEWHCRGHACASHHAQARVDEETGTESRGSEEKVRKVASKVSWYSTNGVIVTLLHIIIIIDQNGAT